MYKLNIQQAHVQIQIEKKKNAKEKAQLEVFCVENNFARKLGGYFFVDSLVNNKY